MFKIFTSMSCCYCMLWSSLWLRSACVRLSTSYWSCPCVWCGRARSFEKSVRPLTPTHPSRVPIYEYEFLFPEIFLCDEPPPGIRTPDAPALEPDTSPATGTAADGSARPSQSWQPQPPMPRPSPPSLPVDGHFHKSQTSHNVAVCHPVSFLVSTPCIVARRQSA